MAINGNFQFRRGVASLWTSSNPILLSGEIGLETDTAKFKIGDGTSAWNSLPYGGIKGDQGIQGVGIASIARTAGNGAAGTTDTYTITYTNAATSTFTVKNGSSVIVGATTVVTPATGPSVSDADGGDNVDLRFSLPRARNVSAGTTNTITPVTSPSVSSGTDGNGDVSLTFNLPRARTVAAGTTNTIAPVTSPSVSSTENGNGDVSLTFNLPRARAVTAGTTTTGSPGTNASVNSANDGNGDVTLNFTIPRGDTGPAANAFTNIAVTGQNTVSADQANDTLTLVAGTNISLTTNDATDSIVIGSTLALQNAFSVITGNSGTATADTPTDTLAITGGTGISTTATDTPDGLVIANTGVTSVVPGTGIGVSSATGSVTITNNDTGGAALSGHNALANPHPQYSRLGKYFFYAEDYGTLTDGTDTGVVSAAQATQNFNTINAALTAAKNANGGGIVVVPPGTYHIDNTFTIDKSGVFLMGAGRYGNSDVGNQTGQGTTLFWNNSGSPATTAMIRVASPAGPTNPAVKGVGVSGFSLQCAGNVGIGLEVTSVHWGEFKNIYIVNATSKAFVTNCLVTGTTLGEAADVTKCTLDNIGIRMLEVADTAVGFSFEGSSNANTSNSTTRNLAVSCKGAQIAMDFRNTDSNRLYDTVINQSNGGTVQPIVLRGGATSALASRGNMFFGLATGGSSTGIRGLKSEGTDTAGVVAPAMNNVVYGYSIENGEPCPLIGTGSVLDYYLSGGDVALARRPTLTNATAVTETVVARWLLPENSLAANVAYEINVGAQVSGTTTLIYRVRVGTTGTTTDAVAGTFATSAAGVANAHSFVKAVLYGLTAGASGTCTVSGVAALAAASRTMATAAFAAATVNTTARLFVSVTVQQSVARTHTTRIGSLVRIT